MIRNPARIILENEFYIETAVETMSRKIKEIREETTETGRSVSLVSEN
jgi:hypothetical protein